ncbi:MAG TPA: RDD family protein [Novosphingobium sp.]|nr:RDD family protein [Novosphingobium sp.]
MTAMARTMNGNRERVMVTPEGIAVPIILASRGSRFGALMLDLMLIVAAMTVTTLLLIWIAGGMFNLDQQQADGSALGHALQFLFILWVAAMFLFRNAYFLYFELGPRGATPGKRATGIRIAARDGGRLSAEMVIARNLLRDIELFLPLVFLMSASGGGDMGAAGIAATAWFLIFALFPCFNKDRLRAGDLIAGSWVLEAPKRKLEAAMSLGQAARATSTATGVAYRFGEAELAIYGEYELQTLERVLREGRPEALAAVRDAICAKVGWNTGVGDEHAFLEAYYTQLRARLEGQMRFGKRKPDKHAPGS